MAKIKILDRKDFKPINDHDTDPEPFLWPILKFLLDAGYTPDANVNVCHGWCVDKTGNASWGCKEVIPRKLIEDNFELPLSIKLQDNIFGGVDLLTSAPDGYGETEITGGPTWQIQRLIGVTEFLRTQGFESINILPLDRKNGFMHGWIAKDNAYVWQTDKPIQAELIEDNFEFNPRHVKTTDRGEGGFILADMEPNKARLLISGDPNYWPSGW